MKVIFIDLDNYQVDEYIRRVIRDTGAVVVLTNVWRKDITIFEIVRLSKKLSVNVVDCLPFLSTSRGWEIQAWLDNHSNVSNYAIVDRGDNLLDCQLNYLIETDGEFNQEILERAVAILNK